MGAPLSWELEPFMAGVGSERASSADCGWSSIIKAARRANGKDAKSALSFVREWSVVCPRDECSCGRSSKGRHCFSAIASPAFVAPLGSESSTAAKAKGSAGG
jgi:hypothetical protein